MLQPESTCSTKQSSATKSPCATLPSRSDCKHSLTTRRNAMLVRNLVLVHTVAAAAALCPSTPWHAKFRAPRINAAAGADDDDLAALDAAAKAAQSSADARTADAAAATPLDDDPFWAAVADARIVEGGGASYNRGRVVDASRADADAARARGVADLVRAGELRWAQDADRVALFLPVSEDTKARSINVDVTPRALSLAVDGAPILERAPLRHGVDGEGSSWTLEDVASRCLVLELPKLDDAIVWASLLDGRSREEIEDELAMQFGRDVEEPG